MIIKRCPRCGGTVQVGALCGCRQARYREEDRCKSPEIVAFYRSAEWRRAKQSAIYRCNGLDLYSLYQLGLLEHGFIVHHIVPLEDCWDLRLAPSNLIYLTASNHQKIHDFYKQGTDTKQVTIKLLQGALKRYQGVPKNVAGSP